MSQAKPSDPTSTYSRADYVGLLVRLDIPGTLDYLDQCGEAGRAAALRRKLSDPEPFAAGDPLLDAILNAYQRYFQTCFTPADSTLEAREETARQTLTAQLGDILGQPEMDLGALEQIIGGRFHEAGWHYLGGTTQGYYGPYIWKTTTRTDYDVEIPSGIETVTVFWMDDFLMRSWLDWLSDGEVGAGGWAKDEGLYCVRKAYADKLDQPGFQISFLKHEAQHHADFRLGELEPWLLEYRAKLVELIYYPDSSFLKSLLNSADLANKANSHAYAAGKIITDLSAWLEAQGAADGLRALEAAAADAGNWADVEGVIRKGSRELLGVS